jgi:hypothetical protein
MADAELARSCCQKELETEDIEPDSVGSSLTPPRDGTQHQAERSVPNDLEISERINK